MLLEPEEYDDESVSALLSLSEMKTEVKPKKETPSRGTPKSVFVSKKDDELHDLKVM